jgi:hypothetical protein
MFMCSVAETTSPINAHHVMVCILVIYQCIVKSALLAYTYSSSSMGHSVSKPFPLSCTHLLMLILYFHPLILLGSEENTVL